MWELIQSEKLSVIKLPLNLPGPIYYRSIKIATFTIFSKTFLFDYYFFTSAWFFKTLANLSLGSWHYYFHSFWLHSHVCLWCCVSFLPIVNKLFQSLILWKPTFRYTPTSYIYKSHQSKYNLGRYKFF